MAKWNENPAASENSEKTKYEAKKREKKSWLERSNAALKDNEMKKKTEMKHEIEEEYQSGNVSVRNGNIESGMKNECEEYEERRRKSKKWSEE